MTIFLIISVIFLVLLAGMLLAFLFTRMSRSVTNVQTELASEERAYNPGVTLGHRIRIEANYQAQLKEAREEAAKAAAALPRGGNFRIGRDGESLLATAGENVQNDPMTAVRIARFHGWDGARTGAPSASATNGVATPAVAATTAAAPVVVAPTIAPPQLIEITDSMSPEDVRKARVANAKAQSAYNKALKAAASGAPVMAPPAAGAAPVAAPTAVATALPVNIAPPQLIEITDSMSPEDIRKARVSNAKAQSAYNKALKAAGVDPAALKAGAVAAPAAAAAVAQPVAPVAPAAPAIPAGIDPPKLIEIVDSMSPEEIRQARVANAKAQSAYNKALKAAGVDPATLRAGAAAPAAAAPSAPIVPEPAPIAAAAPAAPVVPAGIELPKLIEITDGMDPEEKRQARVANAKAQSAYNKALKAAGIDPASLR